MKNILTYIELIRNIVFHTHKSDSNNFKPGIDHKSL